MSTDTFLGRRLGLSKGTGRISSPMEVMWLLSRAPCICLPVPNRPGGSISEQGKPERHHATPHACSPRGRSGHHHAAVATWRRPKCCRTLKPEDTTATRRPYWKGTKLDTGAGEGGRGRLSLEPSRRWIPVSSNSPRLAVFFVVVFRFRWNSSSPSAHRHGFFWSWTGKTATETLHCTWPV